VTYRAELRKRALRQLGDFPAKAFDALIEAMARVVEYPDDPMGIFPTSDPYVRRAEFDVAGLVTFVINDADQTVTDRRDLGWLTASAACPRFGAAESLSRSRRGVITPVIDRDHEGPLRPRHHQHHLHRQSH
jgi:hypothetical protein